MKPGAQIQTGIEILDLYDPHRGPLDRYLSQYLGNNRFIGGADRRRICDLVFSIYRSYPTLEWSSVQKKATHLNGRQLMLTYLSSLKNMSTEEIASLFTGTQYHPSPLTPDESLHLNSLIDQEQPLWVQLCFPQWLYERLHEAFVDETPQHLKSLNTQAGIDIRVNTLITHRDLILTKLEESGIKAEPTPYSPFGIRLHSRINLTNLNFLKEGAIELQDEGAQLLSLLCGVKPGMRVCDYCAGSGGKTLTLAMLMHNQGTITVTDESQNRLRGMRARLDRSQAHIILQRTLAEVHNKGRQTYDRVLIDVPCSGTGTLRRRPELKASLTPQKVNELVQIQRQILINAQSLVKSNGRLIYGTCSLLREENESQIAWFLHEYPDFKLIPANAALQEYLNKPLPQCQMYLNLTPFLHQSDGFFGAVLQRQ